MAFSSLGYTLNRVTLIDNLVRTHKRLHS